MSDWWGVRTGSSHGCCVYSSSGSDSTRLIHTQRISRFRASILPMEFSIPNYGGHQGVQSVM
jgi:hypothetical protein